MRETMQACFDRALAISASILFVVVFLVVVVCGGCTPPYIYTPQAKGFVIYTEIHGVKVVDQGWDVSRIDIEREIEEALQAWQAAGVAKVRAVLDEGVVHLVFKPFPFKGPCRGAEQLCDGLMIHGGTMLVGVRSPLSSTALQHELGEVICHRRGIGDCHAFMKAHGLR